jgi:hypothetical protein
MSKTKILNQWQHSNLAVLDSLTVGALKAGDWFNVPLGILRCVNCARHKISSPILKYYGFDGTRLLCYECQEKNKINSPY